MLDEDEWCIVRHRGELLVRKMYQWEAQAHNYAHAWEYVARGFKSNEDALQWVSLFKE
jgi:hypothetical protein